MKPYSEMSREELIARLESLDHGDRDQSELDRVAQNEARLTAILDTAVEGIITIDHRGLIQSVNLAAERMFQWPTSELQGKNVNVLMPTPYRQEHDGYLERYLESGKANIIGIGREVIGLKRDGSVFPIDLAVSEVKAGGGHLFVGFIRDISERKRTEAALKKSEERLGAILSNSPMWIYMKDLEGRYRIANKRFQELMDLDEDKILGHTDDELFSTPIANAMVRGDHRVVATGETSETEERMTLGGSVHHFIIHRFPLFDSGHEPYAVCAVAVEVSERRRLEKEILEVRQDEHRTIGQDLHDNLGQQLTGIEFMSQALGQALDSEQHKMADSARQIAGLVREAISHTRLVARGLNPVEITGEGLMDALSELAKSTSDVFKVECRFDCNDQVLLHDTSIATHLYRVAQESVNNVVKHAGASDIEISLIENNDQISLKVSDNGDGIAMGGKADKPGMGLRVMQYRAGVIGGELTVRRKGDLGTLVECVVPMNGGSNE